MFKFLEDEKKQKMFWGYLFVFPAFLYFLCMNIWPMLYAFFLSFNDWNLLKVEKKFVFLQNYFEVFQDKVFLTSLYNTFAYAIIIVPLGLMIAIFLSVLVNSGIKHVGIFRFMFFIPVITSSIAAGYIWMWLYEPTFGLFNDILSIINIQLPFLKSTYSAKLSIAAVVIWKNLGFQIVILLTGLGAIPNSVYEAAEMDGVTGWRRFRYITLPLLRPTIIFLSVTGFMKVLQMFGEIYVMAPTGGPLDSTTSVVFHIQKTAFESYRLGYSSAMTFILFLIILGITIFQIKYLSGEKN